MLSMWFDYLKLNDYFCQSSKFFNGYWLTRYIFNSAIYQQPSNFNMWCVEKISHHSTWHEWHLQSHNTTTVQRQLKANKVMFLLFPSDDELCFELLPPPLCCAKQTHHQQQYQLRKIIKINHCSTKPLKNVAFLWDMVWMQFSSSKCIKSDFVSIIGGLRALPRPPKMEHLADCNSGRSDQHSACSESREAQGWKISQYFRNIRTCSIFIHWCV